ETFIVATGEERIVKLSLNRTEAAGAPAAAPAPAPAAPAALDSVSPPHRSGAQKALGITSLVIGGVGLTTGVVLGLIAAGKESQLATECTDKQCLPPSHALLDSYHAFGTGSTIAFGVGGAGLVAGIVLLATAPSSSPEKAPEADHGGGTPHPDHARDASVH